MKICGFLLLLSLLSLCLDANPGIKVKITQKGLNFGMQLGTEFLKQRLKNTVFEDWHGLTWTYNYTVSNIRIQHVEFPRRSAFLIPGTGIHLQVNEASAIVTADWRFTSWVLRTSGKLIVYIRGIIISAIATVSQDEAGRPTLFLKTCSGSVDSIDIQLDESSRWLYRIFANFMERPLRNSFNLNLCPSINLEIQRFNAELKQHQIQTQVNSFAVIDYSLVNLPSISHTSFDLDFKGAVYSIVNETEPSFEPDSFILPMGDSMLYIGVSEYFFHSASLAYYTSGAFEVSTEKELSAYFNFTTETFNSIIPMVAYLHIGLCPVIMNLTVTAAPVISLQNDRFLLQFVGSMEVLKIQPNFTTHSMFTLNVTARTHVSLTIFEKNLIPTLCLDSFDLSLAHSSVGLFKASLLKNFMSYILQKGVIPSINVNLKDGIPLPILDTTILVNPVVTVHQGYLLISTDVRLKPAYIWEHNDLKGLEKMRTQ
ncbi:BPI fold-containing family C protein [Sceloporus undulatus]|uniref:BPI fold-containing family C protein n=1 Tax=Sceloporus undulatus TaxID=8520 RepID=UPI001C4BB047|nr:BPI fold-containing family C protein [Sceloporus undulatus]